MKNLGKKRFSERLTVDAYTCSCNCPCNCSCSCNCSCNCSYPGSSSGISNGVSYGVGNGTYRTLTYNTGTGTNSSMGNSLTAYM